MKIKKEEKSKFSLLQIKKTERLVKAIESIETKSAIEEGKLAFMARPFVQATVPHSDPGDVKAWGRENGLLSLSIEPGYTFKNKAPISLGIPYGTIPRLLLFWLTTEALRTKNKKLILGNSFAFFMKKIGLNPSTGGGPRSDNLRLKEQMKRLFSARVAITYEKEIFSRSHYIITEETNLWWSEKNINQNPLFENFVILGEKFFEEIITKPVPVDTRVLAELKQSPLALDLYAWLTYRVFNIKEPYIVSWYQIQNQFGSDFKEIRMFRWKIKKYLQRIILLYPNLKLQYTQNGLLIHPSPSHIPSKSLIILNS